MFAFVLLDLFGCERQTGDAQRLPDLLFEGVAREAHVDHHCRGVAGAGQQTQTLP